MKIKEGAKYLSELRARLLVHFVLVKESQGRQGQYRKAGSIAGEQNRSAAVVTAGDFWQLG